MFADDFSHHTLAAHLKVANDNVVGSATSLLGLILLLFVARSFLESRRRSPCPPGPNQLPIIGSVHKFPKKDLPQAFDQWKESYGDIVYVKVLGTPVIIINSITVAEDLCAKKASSYSSRPINHFTNQMFGYTWSVAAMQPGHLHSAIRRIFRESLGPKSVTKYDSFLQRESQNLIVACQGFQGDPLDPITRLVGKIVVTLAYGPSVFDAHGQELIKLNRTALGEITHLANRFWLVDYIPPLKHIPAWMPGANFKRIAVEAYKRQTRIHCWPWEEVNERYREGTSGSCIATDYIEKGQDQHTARDAIAIMYMAGTDTTSTTLLNFLYAMMVHPEVQRKVQAELDSAVGQSRLPYAGDRPSLPYADAAWKESARWIVPVPLGVPHLNKQEDVYKGMRIPKNSKIILNINAILKDPRIFDSPEVYRPERWLKSYYPQADTLPDVHAIFGFGTRICPGRYLAERVGFTFGMAILAAYEILPLEGDSLPDRTIPPFVDSLVRRPAKFECRFKPRSDLANALS
ncbi:cytochrome P450 [Serendipita vermifera]|nr:cytochrome P450 [Serendipita vermifera]